MSIGTLREQQLHAALKSWLAQPGDAFEQKVDGYHIDILRGELLIEIQTGSFNKLRKKLSNLLPEHRVLLVHPIPETKWVVRQSKRGKQIARRKSPKRGRVEHVFDELLFIPDLIAHPNLRLEVLLTEQEEVWCDDGNGSWRRKHWSVADKRLLQVLDKQEFTCPADYLGLLPPDLPHPFTHQQLAEGLGVPLWVATRMSYCLRKMGALEARGKRGRALLLAASAAADTIGAA